MVTESPVPENPDLLDLLADLDLPGDLAGLDPDQLAGLADAIRRYLVEVMSETGGHLSPNLGVVELTLALHRVFTSPDDAIIWDVGHQAYVHKILTGRADRFPTLRQDGGLSGYPSREESSHDWVENSHASTSLSYGMGMATAGRKGSTVVVIGDGALTGGMAHEALNHIAHSRPEKLVVILNDNGRSYAPTVGGLARHLARLRLDPHYESTKRAIGSRLRRIPRIGEFADETARRIKESIKQMLSPLTFFDVLELKYTGPIDGHDLTLLERTLAQAKDFDEPVVIHVVTDKGKGYQPAIADERDKLHGVGKFDVATGEPILRQITYTDVFETALADVARRHPEVVAVTAAMESSTGLGAMAVEFPGRVHDVGISEQHAVTFAAGLAMAGLRPVVCIYSTFLQRAFDQVMMDVALHGLPVTFVLDRAGITGPDGSSHHGVFDLSFLRTVPGLALAAPANATELCGMLETAVTHGGPVAIRFPKGAVTASPEVPVAAVPFGEWEELSHGEDVVLLANGRMVEAASKAAGRLAEAGVSCTVVNARWVKPLDGRLDRWAADHRLVVTVEDNVVTGGFGAAVLEHLAPTGRRRQGAGHRGAGPLHPFRQRREHPRRARPRRRRDRRSPSEACSTATWCSRSSLGRQNTARAIQSMSSTTSGMLWRLSKTTVPGGIPKPAGTSTQTSVSRIRWAPSSNSIDVTAVAPEGAKWRAEAVTNPSVSVTSMPSTSSRTRRTAARSGASILGSRNRLPARPISRTAIGVSLGSLVTYASIARRNSSVTTGQGRASRSLGTRPVSLTVTVPGRSRSASGLALKAASSSGLKNSSGPSSVSRRTLSAVSHVRSRTLRRYEMSPAPGCPRSAADTTARAVWSLTR